MDAEAILKWVAIAVGFSGWFKVVVDWLANKPKLSGNVLCVMRGVSELNGKKYTTFFLYPYILNSRKNSVHILDYELYIKPTWRSKWSRVDRAYGMEALPSISFTAQDGGKIELGDLKETLIYKKVNPAQHGEPLHGWIPFLADPSYYERKLFRSKLVCIDAYGGRHAIAVKPQREFSIFRLMELAGLKLPASMYQNKQ